MVSLNLGLLPVLNFSRFLSDLNPPDLLGPFLPVFHSFDGPLLPVLDPPDLLGPFLVISLLRGSIDRGFLDVLTVPFDDNLSPFWINGVLQTGWA